MENHVTKGYQNAWLWCFLCCHLIKFWTNSRLADDLGHPDALVIDPSFSLWRHQMETFSPLLALCVGNSPIAGEFPTQRPVTRGFDVFFDLRLNKRLSKQSWGWWFETPSCALWRHSNAVDIFLHLEPLPSIEIDSSTFAHDWLTAIKDQRYTDVIFLLGSGTEMKAHKIVLCAASSFFASLINANLQSKVIHDDVIKWKYFPRYWPFVWGIHRSPVNSPREVKRSFDVFFDLRLNKRLGKQPKRRRFKTPSRSLWHQCKGCQQD